MLTVGGDLGLGTRNVRQVLVHSGRVVRGAARVE